MQRKVVSKKKANKNTRPRWHLLYYVLAAFDVLTVSCSLYLNHSLMKSFDQSVTINQAWADRLGSYSDLATLGTSVNMPANEVFDTGDVEGELKERNHWLNQFSKSLGEVRTDLEEHVDSVIAEGLLQQLGVVSKQMLQMTEIQDQIFDHFRKNESKQAGMKMATMDRANADLSKAISEMGIAVRGIQDRNFQAQHEQAIAVRRFEYVIAVMIILMVLAVTVYGHKIAQQIKISDRALHEAQARFELAIQGSKDAIFDWDVKLDKVYYAPSWKELFGLKAEDEDLPPVIETLFDYVSSSDVNRIKTELVNYVQSGDDNLECEFRIMTKAGDVCWVLLRAAAVRDDDGVATRVSGSLADISSLKAVEQEMRRLVEQDQLTGLSSRSYFMARLDRTIERVRETENDCGLLFFDFDRFKSINDSLGHDVGDELLCSIAERFRKNIHKEDIAARFGGDEFVLLIEKIGNLESVQLYANELLEVFAKPHEIRGHHIISTASVGLVTTENSMRGSMELLRDADVAMYQAKSKGRGCVVTFDQSMHEAALDRIVLEEDLRFALERNDLEIYYQPIIDIESGSVVGAEALVRWNHPERGIVSPVVFIPIAEEANQIVEIGKYILDKVCHQIVEWRSQNVLPSGFCVNINISKVELLNPQFIDHLVHKLKLHQINPKSIKLEVTESTIVDNRSGIENVLTELREHGFVIAMDDFGTGHSSLSGLHILPIDEVKIDQSFISQADTNRELAAITSSILMLANNLSMKTIGEGVESEEHITLLQSMGCKYAQGYFFSPPIPPKEFEGWLYRRDTSWRKSA